MTWGECKANTLHTLSAEQDDGTVFLTAMPDKAAEGLFLLTARLPLVRTHGITVRHGAGEGEYEPSDTPLRIDLAVRLPDLRILRSVLFEGGGRRGEPCGYALEAERYLVLPRADEGVYTLVYEALPERITAATPDASVLPLREDACALLPLYIASQLYKDDDLTLAAVWRNEFEDGLAKLAGGVRFAALRQNMTGWW